jgi:hypothetical protein
MHTYTLNFKSPFQVGQLKIEKNAKVVFFDQCAQILTTLSDAYVLYGGTSA